MNPNPQKLVIIGHGAAGLAAAVSAAEQAGRRGLRVEITLVEKSGEVEAGGNHPLQPVLYAARGTRSSRARF